MRKIVFLIIVIFGLILGNIFISFSHAQSAACDLNALQQCHDPNGPCFDQIKACSDQLNQALTMSINATKPAEDQLNSLEQQLTTIKGRIVAIAQNLAQKKIELDKSYADVAQKTQILNAKIRDFYIKSTYNSPILIFLSSNTASQLTEAMAYQRELAQQDKNVITNIVLSITDLEAKKQQLESENAQLAVLQSNLDDQTAKLDKLVSGAKAYQAVLSNQISQLSSIQQNLLAQKLASLGISTSAYSMSGGCSSDLLPGAPDPGFSPKIGFFTYGVPNRVGLNQYGAKGRAEAGQNYQQILSAYYNATLSTGYNQGINIHVTGTNDYGQSFDTNWNIEDYLKHIYEIPASWPAEALKAQAIAARSYALAYTNNGSSSICPDQHCQEVKQELNSQTWIDAVNATAGQVLTSGGQPIKAWFSSTHGGYAFTSSDIGWSSTDYTKRLVDASGSVGSFSDLQNNAYDKGSPWFYCDWGSRGGTAWLRSSEVADIANVVALVQADSSTKEHLYQTDKPNPAGTDTWDAGRVQQELRNRNITPFTSVSSVSVDADFGNGKVNTVHVNGDAGSMSFSGDFFKTYFNIRAPGNIQIVGPLFNVEIR
ncbi:MAG TPA: SpoIID/LytB domain-containing protein [Patescibacteria group bacterium]